MSEAMMVVKRKRFSMPFALGVLAGVAFGFAAGLAYMSFRRSGDDTLWTEWKYPGATDGSSAGAGMGGFMSAGSVGRAASQRTTDPFDTVVRHYASKAGMPGMVGMGAAGAWTRRAPSGSIENVFYISDGTAPGGPTSPMRRQGFATRGPDGSVVVVITRAEGETETHIMLFWLPRN